MKKQRAAAKERRKERKKAREEARAKAGLDNKSNVTTKVEVCCVEREPGVAKREWRSGREEAGGMTGGILWKGSRVRRGGFRQDINFYLHEGEAGDARALRSSHRPENRGQHLWKSRLHPIRQCLVIFRSEIVGWCAAFSCHAATGNILITPLFLYPFSFPFNPLFRASSFVPSPPVQIQIL